MENQLPTEFDLVVIGTGIVESIISGAASRIGKTVLHVDSNDYYGGQWASFNLKTLHNFSANSNVDELETDNHLSIGNNIFTVKDFQTKWHIAAQADAMDDTVKSGKSSDISKINVEDGNQSITELGEADDADAKPNEALNSSTEHKMEPSHTQESLLEDSRKFNIDLVPKLHFARGDFVELLISSNIARYAEYRSVSRVLTWLNGQLEVVPCSRSDVFANNKVSVIEKRMLMKLLTSLDENQESLKDNESMTFRQFLKEKKLSSNLIHYVLYAMSRSTDETSLAEGIQSTKRFLNSLGRFGKTPFLFSMYGSGETTQAFCRLSAVFGGVYALSQKTLNRLEQEGSKITALINGEQEIKAEHFVLSVEKSPRQFVKSVQVKEYISRAIFITDRSLMPSEQEHLTLLTYPPEKEKNITTIIELGFLTGTCPKNLYLTHLTSKQVEGPQDDFQHIIDNLFDTEMNKTCTGKPKILWSCYFSLPNSNNMELNNDLPENLHLCSGPDLDLDYDLSIKRAKAIFQRMYPDLEFLPRAPDPEEIIIGSDNVQEDSDNFISDNTTN